MTKRIAIYNGFPFHYEMFGTVLEFLTQRGYEFDLYSETRDEMGWFAFYTRRFGDLPFKPLAAFDDAHYDYVFLLTDDDFRYKYFWTRAKVIMFEHSGRRNTSRMTWRRFQTREFTQRVPPSSPDTWVLPVWNIFQRPKTDILKIVAIGNNCPSHPDELTLWIIDISSPHFVFMNRRPAPTQFDHDAWKAFPNVTLLENTDATTMLEHAASADWILMLPKNELQFKHAISACIPVAYGVGTPLLLSKPWCEAYGLKGMCPLDPTSALTKPTAELMAEVFETQEALLKRRDFLFEESLRS